MTRPAAPLQGSLTGLNILHHQIFHIMTVPTHPRKEIVELTTPVRTNARAPNRQTAQFGAVRFHRRQTRHHRTPLYFAYRHHSHSPSS